MSKKRLFLRKNAMIQRIQTLYLLLIVVFSILMLSGSILAVTGIDDSPVIKFGLTGPDYELTGQSDRQIILMKNIITGVTVAGSFLAAVSIFLYRKRKLQHLFTVFLAILSVFLIITMAWLLYLFTAIPGTVVVPGWRILIPPFLLILALLASKGIRHDEKLVRSYERLR